MHNSIKFNPTTAIMQIPWLKACRLKLIRIIEKLWYGRSRLKWVLAPLAYGYQSWMNLRQAYLLKNQESLSVPVIVVGNLTVGGVGKTPLVIALAQNLTAKGWRVGIVSRGYRAKIRNFPHEITPTDTALQVGDEPKLLALKTLCPVVIAPKRLQAVRYLLAKHACQVVISDDGLQHYALPRRVEIAVVDGQRGFGNGLCLPAGPLREPLTRLRQVDFIIINGTMTALGLQQVAHSSTYFMTMDNGLPMSLNTHCPVPWSCLPMPVSAVAGIGHPQRFFSLFDKLGVAYSAHGFPDHHRFVASDLISLQKPIVMTEKDAVKCGDFAIKSMYYVPVEAKLSEEFWTKLYSLLA